MTAQVSSDLRFYCFVHFMLSSIQQGIQTGHASVELVVKYLVDDKQSKGQPYDLVSGWALRDKTYITLNGGNTASLSAITEIITSREERYPWASFNEDGDSLDHLQTAIGVVLPERIYSAVRIDKDKMGRAVYAFGLDTDQEVIYDVDHEDYALVDLLKNSRLAS